jgi:hypothetical protein
MKTKFSFPLTLAIWLGNVVCSFAQGTAFTYQGRLTDNGSPATVVYDFATKSILVSPPLGNRFYRLFKP